MSQLEKRNRYVGFEPDSARIHPLKRLVQALSRWVGSWAQFRIFGLPGREERPEAFGGGPVASVEDGTAMVLGANLSPAWSYIAELTLGAGPFIESRFLKRQRCFPKVHRTDAEVISLVNDGDLNYYRWLMETLPRLRFVEDSKIGCRKIYARQKMPFHRESLRALGGTDMAVISSDETPYLRARRLLVPQLVNENEEWILPWLREKILPLLPAMPAGEQKPRRLYISRAKASGRRVANEAELLGILGEFGFVSIALEDRGWLEQVKLFREAEAIAGPHGAGLANLIFASRGALALEFIAPGYPFTFYPQIGERLGLNYHCLLSEPIEAGKVHASDLIAPIGRVREILRASLGP